MSDQSPPKEYSAVNRRIRRLLTGAHLFAPLVVLSLGLLSMIFVVAAMFAGVAADGLVPLLILALVASVLAFVVGFIRLRKELIVPLARLEESVAQVCSGEPGATLSLRDTGVLGAMVSDLDSLNEELSELYEDMDSRVSRHTTRLAQKTASLKILYDVAASVNQAQDLEELLLRFLRVLKEMVNGISATVRLEQPDGSLRVVRMQMPKFSPRRRIRRLLASLRRKRPACPFPPSVVLSVLA